MIIIDRSVVRRLLAERFEALAGFTVRHQGEEPPKGTDVVLVEVQGFTLAHGARQDPDRDADVAQMTLTLAVLVGTDHDNIYALDSALTRAAAHVMDGAMRDAATGLRIECESWVDDDPGLVSDDQRALRVGTVVVSGQVTRVEGTSIENHTD